MFKDPLGKSPLFTPTVRMIIEVRQAGFVNKGAHLMLLAVVQQLRSRYPDATLVMSPSSRTGPQPFGSLVAAGFRPKASLWRYGMQFGDLARVFPHRLRDRYGIVLDREVNVVLDAAGFAYGAPWGPSALAELAHSATRWRRRGTALILLPQAFGDLSGKNYRAHARRVGQCANLIFTRETPSLEALQDALGKTSNVRRSPDFTVLLPGTPPQDPDRWRDVIAIVPNARMLDQTTSEVGKAYLPFLRSCMREIRSRGGRVAIVTHEAAEDLPLARELAAGHPGSVLVEDSDPLRVKGLLGACRGVIASRFHALVSALSQGVPALGTGWSHKYSALFIDYGVADGLLDPRSSAAATHAAIKLLDDAWSSRMRVELRSRAAQQAAAAQVMWSQVFEVCDRRA